MYLGDESRALSIKDKVSAIVYMETFMIKLRNQIIHQVSNYLVSST